MIDINPNYLKPVVTHNPNSIATNQTHLMEKSKLIGIELGRGLSTYAVVLVHSGDETWGVPVSQNAIGFRLLFYFAVPFFLAAAFYFMTNHSGKGYSLKFWRSRFDRIIIPYAIWSLIFLLFRVIIFTLSGRQERVQQLLADPLALIFLGGASYQLYFLPLLMVGTCWIMLMPVLEKIKLGTYMLIFLATVSITPLYLMEISGNSFDLGHYTAFNHLAQTWQIDLGQQPWLRVMLVFMAWIIRCLPYFGIALTVNCLPSRLKEKLANTHPITWGIVFIFSNFILRDRLHHTLSDLLIAFSLLFFCIALSKFLSRHIRDNAAINSIVLSLGACSFGIYLCHPFVMNLVKPIVSKAFPQVVTSVSIPSMLLISIPSFLISWLIITSLARNKAISKYLF